MAIAKMQKIMIVSHRSEAMELLESLQQAGIVHLLDAERAMVTKEFPELETEFQRPRDIEDIAGRLEKAVAFLDGFDDRKKGLGEILAPRKIVTQQTYAKITSGRQTIELLDRVEFVQKQLDSLTGQRNGLLENIRMFLPWQGLNAEVELLQSTDKTAVFTGLVGNQHIEQLKAGLDGLGAGWEIAGESENRKALIVVCLPENAAEVQKALRAAEFEPVGFGSFKGIPAAIISELQNKLGRIEKQIADARRQAHNLAADKFSLQILFDHYHNLLQKEQTRRLAPETQSTLILEGWVKKRQLEQLERIVSKFGASSMIMIEPSKDEPVPVELENNSLIRPFETITRLYGMPQPTSVDPTVFLAPFFAVFFGLCVADVGYGFMLALALWWMMKKMQTGKQAVMLFFLCSITTIIAGVITGSWFADTVTALIPQQSGIYAGLNGIREKLMLFDPMTQPMIFIVFTLILGYIQINFGFCIALVNNLLSKNFVAAICDQLVWLVFLNNFALMAVIKSGRLPGYPMWVCTATAVVCALTILLFAVRQGNWAARIGMGAFQLFSTVFFIGDILSYVRLMALGMVGCGFGMAINVLVKLLMDVPYVGFILGAVLFVVGHSFNVALSLLGAFVHSMRLQFVEFFPKFFSGGGMDFQPLRKEYKHIIVED